MDLRMTEFEKVAKWLGSAVRASEDKRLLGYYGEYLVASELAKRGYDVKVLGKRRGPDLRIQSTKAMIEVKTGNRGLKGWSCDASFRDGKSIKQKAFQYCVFVVFDNFKPVEYLVFHRNELKEVADRPRPYPITAFPNNRCLLFRYRSLDEYRKEIPRKHRLGIEMRLHQNPGHFKDRWDKI